MQDIVRHAGGERSRRERTASDVQGFERRAGIAPRAAEISAERGRVHDVDVIAVLQRTIRGAEAVEALVHEPVVQRTHPTGVAAAGELCKRAAVFLDRSQVGNGVVICATLPVILLALKCLEDHGHHAVVFGQVIPVVDELFFQRSREGFTLERRVLDDHVDAADDLGILERVVPADSAGRTTLIFGRDRSHRVDRGFSCGGNFSCGFARSDCSQTVVLCLFELCPVLTGVVRLDVGVELGQNSLFRGVSCLLKRFSLCPADRDRYILIGHCELRIGVIKLHVDCLRVFALVLTDVIDLVSIGCNIALADTGIGDALEFIRSAVNQDNQISVDLIALDRLTAGCSGVRDNQFRIDQVLVTERPLCALGRERAICIAKLEVRSVIQTRENANCRQRCSFTKGCTERFDWCTSSVYKLRFNIRAERKRRCGRECVRGITAATGATILPHRVSTQVSVHGVEDFGGRFIVALDNELQAVGLCGRQLVAVLLHKLDDLFILLLFRAGKQRLLIRVERSIGRLHLLDCVLNRFCVCDLAGVIRQHGKILAETAQRILIVAQHFVLQLLDGCNRSLLRRACFGNGAVGLVQNLNSLVIRRFQLFPCSCAELLLRVCVVDRVKLGFELCFHAVFVGRFADLDLEIRCSHHARVEGRRRLVIFAWFKRRDEIGTFFIE